MNLKIVLFWLVTVAVKSGQTQNSPEAINYINTYKGLAVREMQRSGIPAAIILAQGIHETEAGTSELVRKSNNHFGIKCRDDWKGAVVYHDDDSRGECFRSYATPEDSYRDHSDFLRNSSRYAFLFKLDPEDYAGWAYGLRTAGYATNLRYSQILIKLIRDYNLQQYTLIAIGKLKPSEEVVLGGATDKASGKASDQTVHVSPAPQYPEGEFVLNSARVIFVNGGVSLLSIAERYDISLARLLDFNDLKEEDVLVHGQLLFLQRKRRKGATEFHMVREGESLYDICQSEGLRYADLLEMNQLKDGAQPAVGEKIYLQSSAPSRPRLANENPGLNKLDSTGPGIGSIYQTEINQAVCQLSGYTEKSLSPI